MLVSYVRDMLGEEPTVFGRPANAPAMLQQMHQQRHTDVRSFAFDVSLQGCSNDADWLLGQRGTSRELCCTSTSLFKIHNDGD